MQTFALTDRLEAEVAEFGKVLSAMPDDLLLDTMSAPPPKSNKPIRWNTQPLEADDIYPDQVESD